MAVQQPFSTVAKILYAQVLMAALVASGFLMIGGWKYAFSPLIGSGVALLPNVYFAYRIFLARHRQPQGILQAFYTGETIKLGMTAALFAIVLQLPSIDFLTLLVGYVAVLSVFWLALLFVRS